MQFREGQQPFSADLDMERRRNILENQKLQNFELNGKRAKFLTLSHDGELALELMRPGLEQLVKDSGVVVLEMAPAAWQTRSPENIKLALDYLKSQDVSISEEEYLQLLDQDPASVFYAGLEKIVADSGKDLVTLDPYGRNIVDNSKLTEKEAAINSAKHVLFLLGIAGAASAGGLLAKRALKGKMPRRSFLKTAAVGIFSAAAALTAKSSEKAGSDSERMSGGKSKLLYDLYDYRDIGVAEGLDQLTKKTAYNDYLAVYGYLHRQSVSSYFFSPSERVARYKAYRPYRRIIDLKTDVYSFNKSAQAWDLKSSSPTFEE